MPDEPTEAEELDFSYTDAIARAWTFAAPPRPGVEYDYDLYLSHGQIVVSAEPKQR